MAHHQLAQRHERKAQGSFCCCPRAGCRRTTAADPGQRSATSAWGGGLAHRRTQDVRREEILSRQPAGEDRPAHLSRHHQGTLDLRAASPAAERTTLSRSLRGAILARASPSRAYDNDRLRLPPAPPSRNSEAEKKNQRPAASAHFARRAPRNRPTLRSIAAAAMPALSKMDVHRAAA